MPALGCLIPFVLLIVGAGAGGAWGGTTYAIWGGIAGLVIGGVGAALALRTFDRARDDMPQ
jgi:hypothetical protein